MREQGTPTEHDLRTAIYGMPYALVLRDPPDPEPADLLGEMQELAAELREQGWSVSIEVTEP